ncbi:MAG: mechanosensitive ion channel family protein, partial [Myxococcota bacterium]
GVLGLGIGLLVLAVAINAWVPSRRSRLRRVVLLVGSAAAAAGAELGARSLGLSVAAHWLHLATDLGCAFAAVNLVAVAVFDLGLPRLAVEIAPIVAELVVASGWMLAAVVVLTVSGVDLTGFVAASTIAAAILTISLQTTLGNVVGGIAVQLDGSIRAGDWLALDDGRQGRVREVRWRHTVLQTRDGDAIVVPNSSLLTMLVTILGRADDGRPGPHRLAIELATDVTTPPDRVVAVVEQALRDSPLDNVVPIPAPDCVCVDLGAGNVGFARFTARVWIADPARDQVTATAVRSRIHAAMRRAGLPFGVPSTGVYKQGARGELDRTKVDELRADARRLLDRVGLFDPLTADEKDQLAPRLRHAPYCDGEIVTREGDTAHWLYLLAAGRVRVSATVDGASSTVANLDAPALFGEMGLMTGEPRAATVAAASPVECWRLDKADFDEFLRNRPAIAHDLSAVLAERRSGLSDARELDAAVRAAERVRDQARILHRIQAFFGLRA